VFNSNLYGDISELYAKAGLCRITSFIGFKDLSAINGFSLVSA
jgi:hypothetical protein